MRAVQPQILDLLLRMRRRNCRCTLVALPIWANACGSPSDLREILFDWNRDMIQFEQDLCGFVVYLISPYLTRLGANHDDDEASPSLLV
jgi:hypothetical protein